MTGIIILAAGESGRLGHPKQKLLYHGETLLDNAVAAALQTSCRPVIVVLGAYEAEIKQATEVTIVYNMDWKEGMASSIRTGLIEIIYNTSIDEVIIMLCDQPFVNSALLNGLINTQKDTGKSIIASGYNGISGVPALFKRIHFGALMSLQGADGAKKVFSDNLTDTSIIPFEAGAIDIDTAADYENLKILGN